MSFQVEAAHFENIEFDNLNRWIDELDKFLKRELTDYICFIHTHGAFPDPNIPDGIVQISKGRRSFLIFGNQNQFYKLGQNVSLNKAIDSVGAYGFVKLYIVSKADEQLVTEAIKRKKLGFYSDTQELDEAFMSALLGLENGFIEIETWTECTPDGKGGEWTYLKTFRADNLPNLPTVFA